MAAPARTQQGLVQNVWSVGATQDDDPRGGGEAVHLNEELIEGVLPLVVPPRKASAPTSTADGVYLICSAQCQVGVAKQLTGLTDLCSCQTCRVWLPAGDQGLACPQCHTPAKLKGA